MLNPFGNRRKGPGAPPDLMRAALGSTEVLRGARDAEPAAPASRAGREAGELPRESAQEASQLRGIEQGARAGSAPAPDVTLSLLADLRRLRRSLNQIREAILRFDSDPGAWADRRRLADLVAEVMAISNEVEPDLPARATPGGAASAASGDFHPPRTAPPGPPRGRVAEPRRGDCKLLAWRMGPHPSGSAARRAFRAGMHRWSMSFTGGSDA